MGRCLLGNFPMITQIIAKEVLEPREKRYLNGDSARLLEDIAITSEIVSFMVKVFANYPNNQ